MRIGIPREIKPQEARVALIPEACADLARNGHRVLVERGAGVGSGFPDADYEAAGAALVGEAAELYAEAELVVKVKEPWGPEPGMLREGQLLFSFLHLAADPGLVERLCETGVTALAFETVVDGGRLPVLAPMSDIAGGLAVQIGSGLLLGPSGGKGVLLGGVAGSERGRVAVLGAGNAGSAAVRAAAACGACVTVFDLDAWKLRQMQLVGPNVTCLYPYPDSLERAVAGADLLVGAVLVPGARAPRLISEGQVASMARGSVVVDVSVDQGGCVETTRPTTYEHPTFIEHGVVHFGVTNMPGAVPRTASRALCASLFPWVLRLARHDWREDPVLARALNLDGGKVVLDTLAE